VNDQPAANPAADDPTARLGHDATVTDGDLAVVAEQLGRLPRGVVGIAARCRCGRPLVVRTAPRLDDGTPFPTTYYLTHPVLVAAASTLEANGVMKEMSERLTQDEELAAAYRRAHEHYLAQREELGHVDEIDGISAGGMPTRVKCLHVLIGHALAAGPGVQPLGDEALEMIRDTWNRDRCFC
jgi:hypothetical protein